MRISKELKEAIDDYLNGTATPEQQTMVSNWYKSVDDELVEVETDTPERMELVGQRIRERVARTVEEPAQTVVELSPARNRRRWLVAVSSAAAILAIVWLLLPTPVTPPIIQIVRTGIGETKEIMLPDSSRVWLNAMSQISYAEGFPNNREVILDGEAFFDITHQEDKRFVVRAGKTSTTVLGTAFSVNSYRADEEVLVTVIRGKVQVADEKTSSSILTPGKQLSYASRSGRMQESMTDTVLEPSWMQGKLEYDAMPLEDITTTLERWFNVSFEFENDAIRHCNYTGFFTRDMQLKTVLDLFSQINNITYKLNNDETKVTLSGKGCQ